MTRIITARLKLRKLRQPDLPALVRQINDWEVARWLSRVPYPYTMQDAESWLEISESQPLNLNIFLDDLLIGGVGLTARDDGFYELGFWLGRHYWGQGYATEAAAALLDYARTGLALDKLKASYMTGNDASANVLDKLGFARTGTLEMPCESRGGSVTCVSMTWTG